ncbi:MAG: hypothetical protein JXM79_21190, partial [Sedimentisphaerales bacterium]|nr:hypothetical protein [Sedimentisphaerales bacterium]
FGQSIVVHKNPGRPGVANRLRGQIIVRRPFLNRIGPKCPHHKIVVLRTPYGRLIKAFPDPRSQGASRFEAFRRPIVIVWINNSDGSRTAVELVRRGRGFIGPRGEWYPEMPSKRQIWFAYGF